MQWSVVANNVGHPIGCCLVVWRGWAGSVKCRRQSQRDLQTRHMGCGNMLVWARSPGDCRPTRRAVLEGVLPACADAPCLGSLTNECLVNSVRCNSRTGNWARQAIMSRKRWAPLKRTLGRWGANGRRWYAATASCSIVRCLWPTVVSSVCLRSHDRNDSNRPVRTRMPIGKGTVRQPDRPCRVGGVLRALRDARSYLGASGSNGQGRSGRGWAWTTQEHSESAGSV